jgi:hypothetical protein
MDRGTKFRYILSAAFLLALLVAVGISQNQPTQGKNLCTGKPGGNALVLIDWSDDINQTTFNAIKDRMEMIVLDDSKVKPNDRVSVFLLTDDFSKVKPVFDFCRPITGGNPLTTNPQVQQAFQLFFEKRLKEGLSQKPAEVSSSPLLEMISTLGRTNYFNENRRSLFVFSDLLQYNKDSVNLYSACSGDGSPKTKAELALNTYRKNSQSYPQIQLSRDVKVELHQIPRPKEKNIQQACITAFWSDAFGQASPSIDPLP